MLNERWRKENKRSATGVSIMSTQTRYYLESTSSGASHLRGDAGRICSLGNHRLYRQGRNYKIRIGVDADSSVQYEVFALRNDWMIHQAWKLAFQTFMNNSKEEMDVAAKNGLKARWLDFRTEFAGTAPVADLNPVLWSDAGTATQLTTGEFVPSIVTDEAGVSKTFRWGQASGASSYNPLEEYQRIGNTSENPSSPTPAAAYSALDDDTQDGQLNHLSDAGNLPPYDTNLMNTLQPWVRIGVIGGSASGVQNLSTGYFHAPCGLFYIRRVDDAPIGDIQPELFIEYASGDYKGISAPSMGTAKLVKNHYEVK